MLGDIDRDDAPVVFLQFGVEIAGPERKSTLPREFMAILYEMLRDPGSILDVERANLLRGEQFCIGLRRLLGMWLKSGDGRIDLWTDDAALARREARPFDPSPAISGFDGVSVSPFGRTLPELMLRQIHPQDPRATKSIPFIDDWWDLPFAVSADVVYQGSFGLANVKIYVGRNKLLTFLTGLALAQQILNGTPATIDVARQFHAFAQQQIELLAGDHARLEWATDIPHEIDWDALMWDILNEIQRRDEEANPEPPTLLGRT